MRIVLTCDFFLKYVCSLAVGLRAAGAEVLILCRDHSIEFSGDEEERQRTLQTAKRHGVEIAEIAGRLWDARLAGDLMRIRRQIRSFAPTVVHAQDGADPRALLLLTDAPVVLTVHDPVWHPGQPVSPFAPKRWFLASARNAWRSKAKALVIHSEHLRHELSLGRGQRCAVIPHGLYAAVAPLPVPTQHAVGIFGRLEPYKGLEVLAAAMPRVWEVRPEVRLHIVGEGAAELPLSDSRVDLQRRYLPESEIESFFSKLSVAVLPYTHASQTGPGSQAVGRGVPTIVSRVGGLPDVALDESYVVEPRNPEQLAAAILSHIDDGAAVRERVLREIAGPRSWEAVARRSLELDRELSAAASVPASARAAAPQSS